MVWCPWNDADAITEAGLISVQLDGADRRCPVVVFELFGIVRVPLPPGELEGVLSIEKATASYCMIGSEAQVRWRGCHEGGHLMLHLSGRRLPHDESLASRCGRALAMGRRFVLRLLDEGWRDYEIVQGYAWWLPEEQIERRIWEVRRTVIRRVGLSASRWVSLHGQVARECLWCPRNKAAGHVRPSRIADGLQSFLAGEGDLDRGSRAKEDHVQAIRRDRDVGDAGDADAAKGGNGSLLLSHGAAVCPGRVRGRDGLQG